MTFNKVITNLIPKFYPIQIIRDPNVRATLFDKNKPCFCE